jgi:dihydroneopterin aldolase/D-erythro-7,8-dihydroneopterin triphosphate epimerase
MSDIIEIHDLLLRTIIGVNPDERVNRQDVLVNVRLETDLTPAGRSDDLEDAVNYRTITKDIIDHVEASTYHLVERLAEETARVCLQDQRVSRVTVSVQKPGALRFARSVGVTITRSQNVGVPPSGGRAGS